MQADLYEGFQEHWAANFARRMEERTGAALATRDPDARRRALEDALELGKEARLRMESGPTHNEAERAALSHLQDALDLVQAALNAFDVCHDPPIREALEHAAQAAGALEQVG